MAFLLATPPSSAFLSAGVAVTRDPMSSLSSVRYWKACESIIPSPAILTSAGFVPSSSGPFGTGRLSPRAVHATPKENPIAATATPAKTRRIRFLLTPFTQTNSTTLSDAPASIRFLPLNCFLSSGSFLPLCTLRFLCPLCKILCFFSRHPPHSAVHIRLRARSHVFTHSCPRPKLPPRPSCDSIQASIRIFAHSHSLASLPTSFLLSLRRNKLRKSHKRHPAQWLRLPTNPHTPLKLSSSKPATDSKPMGTAATKSMPACTSTASLASACSPASTST